MKRCSHYLRRPGREKGRKVKSFSIVRRPSTGRAYTLKVPALKIINEQFQKQIITFYEAERQAKALIAKLNIEANPQLPVVVSNQENLKILRSFLDERYSGKQIVDLASAEGDYRRAVEAVGTVSLLHGTKAEFQKELARRCLGNIQRRRAQRLNEILAWLKRSEEQVWLVKKTLTDIRYLSQEELERVVKKIPVPEHKLLVRCLFAIGARFGELFAVEPEHVHIKEKYVRIIGQIKSDFTRTETKRGRQPAAVIAKGYEKYIQQWMKLDWETKQKLRHLKARDVLTPICKSLFPNNPRKHCTFHDLRHSYAIHFLRNRNSTTQVARCLGNSVEMVEQYYAGFVLVVEEIKSIRR